MLFQLIGGDIPYPAFGRERQNADLFSPFIDQQSASRPGLAARRVPDSHVAFQPPLPAPLRQDPAPSSPTPGHRPARRGSSDPAHVAHPPASAPACFSFAFSPAITLCGSRARAPAHRTPFTLSGVFVTRLTTVRRYQGEPLAVVIADTHIPRRARTLPEGLTPY